MTETSLGMAKNPIRIAIVAGHDLTETGASLKIDNNVYIEHFLARLITIEIENRLKERGHEVKQFYGTRFKKANNINDWQADIAIEIHFNKSDADVIGTETLYDEGSKRGKLLSESIQKELINKLSTHNREAKEGWYQGKIGNRLSFLHNTKMPAVIVEVCFLNEQDIRRVIGIPSRSTWYVKPATAIVAGIENYIGAINV